MTMEKFPADLKPTVPATRTAQPDIETIQLGRGYKEDVVLSSNVFKVYGLRWENYRPAEVDRIEAFLMRHYGSRTFRWTDPDGVEGLYRCRQWRTNLTNGLYSLSATFEEVNY